LVKIAGRAFVVASIATTIAFTVSWLLVQYTTEKFQTLFLVVITLPFLINESIRIFSWQYFLAENGLINRFLSFVSGYDVRLMNGSNSWNIYVVMIIACIPFGVFICAATLKTIPHIFWKSASDLKLSEMSKLLKIGLPLSKFAIATSLIILFFIAFSMSSEVNFLGGDTKISTRNFVLSLMSAGKFQAIFALGFFIVLLVLLIYLGGLFYTKKKNK
jgi:spermidine/putrescine transport system permease protein/putrescine transport system permease protein